MLSSLWQIKDELQLLILAATIAVALWRGAGPERACASTYLAMWLGDRFYHLLAGKLEVLGGADLGHVIIDALTATSLVVVALSRAWPRLTDVPKAGFMPDQSISRVSARCPDGVNLTNGVSARCSISTRPCAASSPAKRRTTFGVTAACQATSAQDTSASGPLAASTSNRSHAGSEKLADPKIRRRLALKCSALLAID